MIDGYRQVNLRVSTLEKINELKEKVKLKSVDAVVKYLITFKEDSL